MIRKEWQRENSYWDCDTSTFPSTRKSIVFHKYLEWINNLEEVSVHRTSQYLIQRSLIIIESCNTRPINVWVLCWDYKAESLLSFLLRAALDIGIFKLEKIFGGFEHLDISIKCVHLHSLSSCKDFAFELDLKRLHCERTAGVVAYYLYLAFVARVKLLLVENHLWSALRATKSENPTNLCGDNCS